MRMDLSPFDGLVKIAGAEAQAVYAAAPSFPTSRLVFSSDFSPVQALISFLEALGMPNPLTLAVSNATQKYKMQGNFQLKLPMTLPVPIPTDTPIGKLAITLKSDSAIRAPSEKRAADLFQPVVSANQLQWLVAGSGTSANLRGRRDWF